MTQAKRDTAFLDTTVLADALLKPGEKRDAATKAVRQFSAVIQPVYAIKELQAGPLRGFVWFLNKLVLTRSLDKALDWIGRVARTPNLHATALEAYRVSVARHSPTTLADLVQKHGKLADVDEIEFDRVFVSLRTLILKAWRNRRSLGESAFQLACYDEEGPVERREGGFEIASNKCCTGDCQLVSHLRDHATEVPLLIEAISKASTKQENTRRVAALKALISRGGLTHAECRSLGDAVFALLADPSYTILTTNIGDHALLAGALGKLAATPAGVLAPDAS